MQTITGIAIVDIHDGFMVTFLGPHFVWVAWVFRVGLFVLFYVALHHNIIILWVDESYIEKLES